SLPLTALQSYAAFTDDCSYALRQLLDEVATRGESRLHDFIIAGLWPAVADVLHDRAMEHRNVLRHDTDRGTQALLGDARDVLPVEQNLSGLHVVATLQERGHSRFATAGVTHQP